MAGRFIDDRLGWSASHHLSAPARSAICRTICAWAPTPPGTRWRDHIHAQWTHFTDPANVQPKVSSLLRRAAQHLRTNPPLDVTLENLNKIIESLEAPLPRKKEQAIREVFDPDKDDRQAVSTDIVERVRELGLQPFRAPDALAVYRSRRDSAHRVDGY